LTRREERADWKERRVIMIKKRVIGEIEEINK
jgi:hypothetical protein